MSEAFQSGRAAEIFGRMVVALGGPADLMEAHEKHLPAAPIVREIAPPEGATVTAIDTRAVGIAVVALGGGRIRAADPVDPRVGFTDLAMIGDTGASLATIHAADEESAAEAEAALRAAYTFGERPTSWTAIRSSNGSPKESGGRCAPIPLSICRATRRGRCKSFPASPMPTPARSATGPRRR